MQMFRDKNSRKYFLNIAAGLVMTALVLFVRNGGSELLAATPEPLQEGAFLSALSDMINGYGGGLSAQSVSAGTYSTARLILKSKDAAFDPENYGAVAAIRNNDDMYILQFASGVAAKEAEAKLQSESGTIYVEPDQIISAKSEKYLYDKKDVEKWESSVKAIGADVLGKALKGRSGVVKVAVLDTGISFTAPDLVNRIDTANAISIDEEYSVNQNDEPGQFLTEDAGHGTHVAGIVAKCTEQVPEHVKIMPVRVLDNLGEGYVSVVVSGLRYAADHGAQIINLSMGGDGESVQSITDAINYVISRGCVVVVAAGNERQSTANTFPANIEECVVVGAVNDNGRRASFSNYGESVDVVAPGVSIFSCFYYYYNGITDWYAEESGTSMSVPHAAGAAALIKLGWPETTPLEIEKMLQLSVKDLGESGKDIYYGYGMIDLSKLVSSGSSIRQQAADYQAKKNAKTADEEAARRAAEEEAARKAAEEAAARMAVAYNSNPQPNVGYVIPIRRKQKTGALKVTGLGPNDSVVSWTSSNPALAAVTGRADGICIVRAGKKNGRVVISAVTASGRTVTFQLKVQSKKVSLKGVTLRSRSVMIAAGQSYDLQALPYPVTAGGRIKYSSSNKSAAVISSNGIITGKSRGSTVITIKIGKKKIKVKVIVV